MRVQVFRRKTLALWKLPQPCQRPRSKTVLRVQWLPASETKHRERVHWPSSGSQRPAATLGLVHSTPGGHSPERRAGDQGGAGLCGVLDSMVPPAKQKPQPEAHPRNRHGFCVSLKGTLVSKPWNLGKQNRRPYAGRADLSLKSQRTWGLGGNKALLFLRVPTPSGLGSGTGLLQTGFAATQRRPEAPGLPGPEKRGRPPQSQSETHISPCLPDSEDVSKAIPSVPIYPRGWTSSLTWKSSS